jgi:hypothetical protein
MSGQILVKLPNIKFYIRISLAVLKLLNAGGRKDRNDENFGRFLQIFVANVATQSITFVYIDWLLIYLTPFLQKCMLL